MFNKIFGKRNSIQRAFVIQFIVALCILISISVLVFYIGINNSIQDKLIEINVNSREDSQELLAIVRRCLILTITSIIVISVVIIRITAKKTLQPLTQLNEATKKVASGDFTVKLETKRQDEIAELTENFNKMVKELNSIECLKDDFINNVSHELKTPISSIQGFAELLKTEDISLEERKEYSSIIIEESERLLNLASNILKLSKLDNQERVNKKQEFSVSEQIRKTISVLEPKWKNKNIKFNVHLKDKNFYGSADLMMSVWMNIIDNAIKFSNDNGAIDISVDTNNEGDKIQVIIKDRGIGIKEDEIDKIFDRFYQIDKSHSIEGHGLGLAIVKRTIELSKGSINVSSKEGKGTTFTIELPIEKIENKNIVIK